VRLMTPSSIDRRRARYGRGVLPPNPNQWTNEHHGLDLREELGLSPEIALPHERAFSLLENVTVLPHGAVPAAMKYVDHLRGEGSSRWSGLGIRLSDECELVLYNDAHPLNRIRATLMEEFFHIRLQHPRSVIHLLSSHGESRTFDNEIEQEAYGSGAAALVPYCPLKAMLLERRSSSSIAEVFKVSRDLINYRIKVTRLYSVAKRYRRPS
jgi:hypothetical protein